MATEINNTNYQKLKNVLKEVFQLDQADLDFGIYRIMNQKREEITDFLDNRLLPQVKEVLAANSSGNNTKIQEELNTAIEQAKSLGVDPNTLPKVKELQSKLASSTSVDALEQEVYSHLANFFKRYYKDGDFISLRRYKKDVYAIPYEGEEVKLHWANHDQYYIKTSEYLKNYGFKIAGNKSVKIELKEASTEQNNNKEQSGKERRFKIYEEQAVEVSEDGNTLTLNFTYEQHDKKVKQDKLMVEALTTIVSNLPSEFNDVLALAPTEKNKKRTLLEKHLNDFSARNTFDYFIHKDLGGFLSRELDFYIKNEVLYLDDINTDNEQDFTAQLSKVKALKQVAQKIITFLAQLENFQKKLWLKKKFVVSTNYCITLDKIPESYYPEIAANNDQLEEWKELFKIHEIKDDLLTVAYSEPLTIDFLKSQPYLVLDTKFFSQEFKEKLLAEFDDLEKQTNGLLINSENFQALNLLKKKYKEKANLAYIDPPYNTDATPILYKNDYKDSSWLSLLRDRMVLGKMLLKKEVGVFSAAIDDIEVANLSKLMSQEFDNYELKKAIVQHYPGSGTGRSNITRTHEYNLFMVPEGEDVLRGKVTRDGFRERGFRRAGTGENNYRTGRPNSFFAVVIDDKIFDEESESYKIIRVEKPPIGNDYPKGRTKDDFLRIYPIGSDGSERVWSLSYEGAKDAIENQMLKCSRNFSVIRIYFDEQARSLVDSIWTNSKFSATTFGTNLLKDIFADSSLFSYPKSLHTMETVIDTVTHDDTNSFVIDFFAGSGTTGHAVQILNRKNKSNLKFLLVEMGTYFNIVTKPRILKTSYSNNWSKGLPVDYSGMSNMYKYQDIESYEDSLNNLTLKASTNQSNLLANSNFNDEYLLSYMLDVESRDSLLNIDAFKNPFNYKLNITRNNESQETVIDLVETFNYLIGLHVKTIQTIKGFKVITGLTNERGEETLVIWRNTEEKSNADLNDFFSKMEFSTRDTEFDRIYVNGDNHLENLKIGDEKWKVVLIEEEFTKRMFDVQDV
ncbi:DNA methyltransferase [uncultured Polaribacter sp.]|uniref:DNA methyltransferase n=1 Tax=uncultured Polaribacter sp. TaxID=174711 RepID=UPI0026079603|nr:DNA methyltransferase [uncultured Polaribacter sp.]